MSMNKLNKQHHDISLALMTQNKANHLIIIGPLEINTIMNTMIKRIM